MLYIILYIIFVIYIYNLYIYYILYMSIYIYIYIYITNINIKKKISLYIRWKIWYIWILKKCTIFKKVHNKNKINIALISFCTIVCLLNKHTRLVCFYVKQTNNNWHIYYSCLASIINILVHIIYIEIIIVLSS